MNRTARLDENSFIQKPLSTVFDYILIITACVMMTGPMWEGSLFYSHENLLAPLRVSQVHRCITEGDYLVRWFPDYALGFGLPQLVFFPPFSLYLTELFHLLGLSLYQAIKIAFGFGIVTAALGMYLLIRTVFDRLAAILAAIAYIYAPYHILNLYVRGDLHEFLALSFLPYILWGLTKLEATNWFRYWCCSCSAYAVLILCHNLSAILFTPALVLFCLLLPIGSKRSLTLIARCVSFFIVTFLLTCFFWAPALLEKEFVKIDVLTKGFGNYHDHFIQLHQFIATEWGFGESVRGPNDTINFQIGNVALVLAILSFFLVIPRLHLKSIQGVFVLWAFIVVPGSIFMMTETSELLWQIIPVLPYFQFPYRFLGLTTLGVSVLAGSFISFIPHRFSLIKIGSTFILVALIMWFNLPYCKVIDYIRVPEEQITPKMIRSMRNTVATGEYIPRWVPEFPPPRPFRGQLMKIPKAGFDRQEMDRRLRERVKRDLELDLYLERDVPLGGQVVQPQTVQVLEGDCVLHEVEFGSNRIRISGYTLKPAKLRIGAFYFPGWHCSINGRSVEVHPEIKTGLIVIDLGEGSQDIRLTFGSTPVRLFSGLLSLGALALLSLGVIKAWIRRRI